MKDKERQIVDSSNPRNWKILPAREWSPTGTRKIRDKHGEYVNIQTWSSQRR